MVVTTNPEGWAYRRHLQKNPHCITPEELRRRLAVIEVMVEQLAVETLWVPGLNVPCQSIRSALIHLQAAADQSHRVGPTIVPVLPRLPENTSNTEEQP
jgi:hypothetical protein